MCTIGHTEAAIDLQNRVFNRHTSLADLACRSLHRTVFRVRAFGWCASAPCADFFQSPNSSCCPCFRRLPTRLASADIRSSVRGVGGYSMEGVEVVGWVSGFSSWIIGLASAAFRDFWQLFTIQNLATLLSTGFAIWKWWEAREVNLFLRFERMISRYEHQLVRVRSDLLDVINRPGPGVLIRTPALHEREASSCLAATKVALGLALAYRSDRRPPA